MRRLKIRFMLTFFAGVMVAAAVSGLSASVVNSAQTRYDDLSLFTNVLTPKQVNLTWCPAKSPDFGTCSVWA